MLGRIRAVARLPFFPTLIGIVVLGLGSYAFLALAARATSAADFSGLSMVWTIVFTAGPGLLLPIEQEIARRLASSGQTRMRDVVAHPRGLLLVYGLLVSVPLLAFSPVITGRLLVHNWALFAALVWAALMQVPLFLTRGIAAGRREYGRYGASLGVDGAARLLLAVGLFAAGVASVTVYAAVLGISAVVAVAATTRFSVPRAERAPVDQGSLPRALGWTLGGTVSSNLLVNAGPLAVGALAANDDAAAGKYLTSLVVARIPLFLFAAVQAVLLPELARALAAGDLRGFRRSVARYVLLVGGVGGVATVLFAAVGPWVTGLVFGATYRADRTVLTLVAAGCAVFMVASVLSQAMLALRRPHLTAVGWLFGLVSFVALLALPGSISTRVSIAMLAGSALVTLTFTVLVMRQRSVASTDSRVSA